MDLPTPDSEIPAMRSPSGTPNATGGVWGPSLLLPLCSAALFLSAMILFAIEPMFTKMVLPLLGGTPAVWNTAVMFFQAVLLAGYLYAHLLSRLKGLRNQALVHVGVLLIGLLFLPVHIGLAWSPAASAHPAPWLIALLAVSIGMPFFAISATAPLLQSWFSRSDHPHASDPYFLYVSSNIGGVVALVAYPTVVEPTFGLTLQGQLWTIGYALLVAMIALYSLNLWMSRRERGQGELAQIAASVDTMARAGLSESVTWATRARWVALAFVPSALLLAVTLHISTDVASAPFLWIAPLLLYSLSFILVFARRPLLKHKWMLALQPWVYVLVALHFTQREPLCFTLPLHLAALFMAAMVCHGELVRRRPTVEHLTEFYFWMSAGGLLGGIFCVLIAPVAFNSVFEYPLVLVLGCLLLPALGRTSPYDFCAGARMGVLRELFGYGFYIIFPAVLLGLSLLVWPTPSSWAISQGTVAKASAVVLVDLAVGLALCVCRRFGLLRYALDLVLAATFAGLYYLGQQHQDWWNVGRLGAFKIGPHELGPIETAPILFWLTLGLVLYLFRKRPLRFAVAFGVLIGTAVYSNEMEHQLLRQRSFFGVYTVTASNSGREHNLYHGTTLHGDEDMDPNHLRTPRTYYDREGPLAQVFESMRSGHKLRHVGVMGLGTGTTSCYHEPNETMTFFEIDPMMERIARNPTLFRYLEVAGPDVGVVIGDGRQNLSRAPDGRFDLLILDAFSSDAIPVHLLTREALAIYLDKLACGGIVLFHISNRFVDLEPVVANIAADVGAAALIQDYSPSSEQESEAGACASTWVAVARERSDLASLQADDRWKVPKVNTRVGVWTDDYSNIFRALIWGKVFSGW